MVAAAVMAGFCIGRLASGRDEPEEENDPRDEKGRGIKEETGGGGRRRERKDLRREKIFSVGSPVSGEISAMQEGENPAVVIHPSEDKLYAPAGGKITKLFPMGNAFLFSTEFGAELLIQAGNSKDELFERYYRPRILQNEIVPKGKLLLEFDRRGLESEGVSPEVSVYVKTKAYGSNILATAGERVKTGEEILRVLQAPGKEFSALDSVHP